MITWENYEEFMVMHADGELSAAQEQELMSFLYEHPDLQSELTAFSMTKLVPETITYSAKDSLLRHENAAAPAQSPKTIAFPSWRRYAVAAGVAAVMFFSFYKLANPFNNNIQSFVMLDTQNQNTQTATTNAAQEKALAEAIQAATTPTPAPSKINSTPTTIASVAHTSKQTTKQVHSIAATQVSKAVVPVKSLPVANIEKLPASEIKELSQQKIFLAPAVTNLPSVAINIQTDEETAKESLLDKLPIDEKKKEGMKSFANEVASSYDKVNKIRQDIAQSSFSLRLKNKKLIVSF